MKTKYYCPSCSAPVLKARWELGYEYCTNPVCIKKLGKTKVNIYEGPPQPDEMADMSPYKLDDVEAMYGYEIDD